MIKLFAQLLLIIATFALTACKSNEVDLTGRFTLKTRGVQFELVLENDGHFKQKITMPDGQEYRSEGPWRVLIVDGNQYLNAKNVIFTQVCHIPLNEDLINEEGQEINSSIRNSWFSGRRILLCSDGRELVSD